MTVDYRVISIGTLTAHPLWNESGDVRTGHATCVLVSSENEQILVDPSLPGPMLEARLAERCNVPAHEITQVFLTSFSLEHYRGIASFPDARWFVHEPERDAAAARMDEQLDRAREIGDPELLRGLEHQIELLRRCQVAPDSLATAVDLFPMPGVTPGACGLILSLPGSTVLVCGDAVATVEHLRDAKVLPTSADVEQATESFREAVEIADILIAGRDNVLLNPLRPVG